MQIQINSDNVLKAGAPTIAAVEAMLLDRLGRFAPRLSRLEAHLKDINSTSAGTPAIHCTLEARPNGIDPLTVESSAETIDKAVADAAAKLITALDRTFGKLTDRKGH
jgi:hypothetical protein